MEKRALLAAILSLAVLYAWSALFPPAKPNMTTERITQHVDVKEDTKISAKTPAIIEDVPRQEHVPSELTTQINSEALTLNFSNIGGSLRSATVNKYQTTLPVEYLGNDGAAPGLSYAQQLKADRGILYIGEANGWQIRKKYSIKQDHIITAEIEVQNTSEMSKQAELPISIMSIDISRLDKDEVNPQDRMLFEYSLASGAATTRKHDAFKFSSKEAKTGQGIVDWLGFRNKYFATVVKPNFESAGYEIVPVGEQKLEFNVKPHPTELQPGQSVTYGFNIFSGPQDIDLLKSYGLGLEKIVVYSNFGLIDVIAKFIYTFMHQMHRLIPNWAICIILTKI
ncbi:MAG TPA: membrane protein insertase YidC, partial [Candidatus Omnitrophota bacterium]|nr:membrane protein insertase YidC [Candidatus Omnitrophota bacterium]